MITALEMRNWRSHAHTRLHFGKGTNLILGIMGSGKSAVLDAVCYALYGTFPALRRKAVSTEDIFRHGENEAGVVLEFLHNGKAYRVVRMLRKAVRGAEAAAKIYEDGKLLDSGQARVSEIVAEKLGMEYDLFNRAVYSEQNNIGYFLELDAGRRKKEMDSLMGLDRFEEARANAVRVINRLESERKALAQRYDRERHAEIMKLLEEKKAVLRKEEGRAEDAERALASRKKEAAAADRELEGMRKKKERKERAWEALGRERARIEALEADLGGKEASEEKLAGKKAELREAEEGIRRIGEEILALEREGSSLSRNIGALENRAKAAEKAKGEMEEARKALEKILAGKSLEELEGAEKELELRMVEISSQAKSLVAEAEEIEKYLGGLEGKGKCPVCGSELGPGRAEQLKKERATEAAGKRREAAGLKMKLGELEKQLLDAKKRIRCAEALRQKMAVEVEGPGGILAELSAMRRKAEKNAVDISVLKGKKGELEKRAREASFALREMEGLLEKKKALRAAREREKELEMEWKGIAFSSEEFEKLHSKARELRVECERAEGRAREARRAIASIKEMAAVLEKENRVLEDAKADLERRAAMLEQLIAMRNAIGEAQAELRAELVEAINAAMNGIWPILYPYADYRQLRIAAGEEDYSFEVYDGEWRKLEKVASGGERACLSLTLRIAMATVLAPETGWLMLDEPTHNLDKEAVQALAEALENRVPQIVEQAFVITHEENLMNSEFARSYRFSRDKESGGATVVEEL